jgi:hypothetical protein
VYDVARGVDAADQHVGLNLAKLAPFNLSRGDFALAPQRTTQPGGRLGMMRIPSDVCAH